MIQAPPIGNTVKGFDLYHGNTVNVMDMAKGGMEFCFHKATEGTNVLDPMFRTRWPFILEAGLIRGAYHFFHPSQDPVAQAAFFAKTMAPVITFKDLIFMDWEVADSISGDTDREAGFIFLQQVEKLLLKRPIIYGSPYFLEALALDSRFAAYKLWIAEYGVKAPKIPPPWTDWTFWQTGDQGLDYDLFNGTLDQLKALA
jgi:lysozyme